jgi:hypothetical protein
MEVWVDRLDEYRDLWEAGRYLLVRVGARDDEVVIFDPLDRTAIVVDDDEVASLVLQRMRAAGVKVVDELPPAQ